jgi:hypothetical protein
MRVQRCGVRLLNRRGCLVSGLSVLCPLNQFWGLEPMSPWHFLCAKLAEGRRAGPTLRVSPFESSWLDLYVTFYIHYIIIHNSYYFIILYAI